ncbi:MAG: hypothetical protein EOP53_11795 [Sphingobacteriales bacterium]|nr:MAG: hypothetical protein EOP53_11795 [Sphingobacteriales bacterium]
MDKNKLNKLVEETMNSMDVAGKATPAPFLLTRINARMEREDAYSTIWEKVSAFIAKPAVAFPVLAVVLAINFFIIRSSVNNNSSSSASDYSKVATDDYSLSTATSLFDFENGQK